MKRHGFTLLEMLVVVATVAVLAQILLPAMRRTHCDESGFRCQSNLKQIGLGIIQYTQDYDQRLPNVTGGGKVYGWADAIQPYLHSTALYQCPSQSRASNTKAQSNPRRANYTDYWMNQNLSALTMKYVVSPTRIIMAGEGNDGHRLTTARYSLRRFPNRWRNSATSPLNCHMDGRFNLLFEDGHVRSFPSSDIQDDSNPGPGFEF